MIQLFASHEVIVHLTTYVLLTESVYFLRINGRRENVMYLLSLITFRVYISSIRKKKYDSKALFHSKVYVKMRFLFEAVLRVGQ